MSREITMTLNVALNGTTENPYHQWGLAQNPFPQNARMETDTATMRLQSLGGDPIPNVAYIRDRLKGYFSEELIKLCCDQFRPGKMVKFAVSFPVPW